MSPEGNGMMTESRWRVLVFPGGTEIGLGIWNALRHCKDVMLHSAAADVSNHASYVFARHFILPSIHEPGWLAVLNALIERLRIDYIFPAHDDVIAALAAEAPRVRARVVSSPPETCLITRSKRLTYRALRGIVPVPHIYADADAVEAFPVFVKPDRGQGSKDAYLAQGRNELRRLSLDPERTLLLEYLPGDEYTVDCFSDRETGLLFSQGRQRVRTRSGISMHSHPVRDPAFADYARAIASKLALYGAWFFQVRRDGNGTLKLLEVAPRVAGTAVVSQVQGINLPLLSLYEQERVPVEILLNEIDVEVDRALVNRYRHTVAFRTVYVDFDDTLVIRGDVNVDLVRFLYQCVNRNIRLVLLTRHGMDIHASLRQHRLDSLFDDIVQLGREASKADYITERQAILIDDSFRERKAVQEHRRIPTFDCSMVEMLLDDRV